MHLSNHISEMKLNRLYITKGIIKPYRHNYMHESLEIHPLVYHNFTFNYNMSHNVVHSFISIQLSKR